MPSTIAPAIAPLLPEASAPMIAPMASQTRRNPPMTITLLRLLRAIWWYI